MKNFVQQGNVVTATAPADVAGGEPVLIGPALAGVATGDAKTGDQVEVLVSGVVSLTGGGAVGSAVYLDSGTNAVSTVDTAGPRLGHVVAVNGSKVHVRLAP